LYITTSLLFYLFITADEQLLNNVWFNASHILRSVLPPESSASQNYSLRPRIHNLQLLVTSLTVTLSCQYFLKTSTSILCANYFTTANFHIM